MNSFEDFAQECFDDDLGLTLTFLSRLNLLSTHLFRKSSWNLYKNFVQKLIIPQVTMNYLGDKHIHNTLLVSHKFLNLVCILCFQRELKSLRIYRCIEAYIWVSVNQRISGMIMFSIILG